MAIGAILGVLFFLAFAGALVLTIINFGRANKCRTLDDKKKYKVRNFISMPVCVACFLLFLFIPFSFHTVNAGEIAVVKTLGRITNVRSAGTYFDFWMVKSYNKYDAKVQQINIKTSAYTSDSQPMEIALTVQFQIQQEKIERIATDYGELDRLSNRIENIAMERTKSVLSKYKAEKLIMDRSEISPEVEGAIRDAISDKFYVDFNAAVLTDIDFSDAFEKAVEEKMTAEQEKLKADYENQKKIEQAKAELEIAQKKAETRIEEARGQAEAQRLLAQAEADAVKLKSIEVARMLGFTVTKDPAAEGDVYYIDFTNEDKERVNLISEYLKYAAYLEAWDGKLPDTIVTNGGASILIPTPGSGNTEGGTETNP